MAKEELAAISRKLKDRFGDKIIDVIVFGSYVRGDYDNDSDIDILVIVSDEKIEKDVRKVAYSFIPEVKRLISVKVVGRDAFNAMKKSNFSFIRSIEGEGISIGRNRT
jgi:predicted nucleotidyltransferase